MLLLWDLTLTELETKLNADTLFTPDLVVVAAAQLAGDRAGTTTSAKLYDFTINGTAIDAGDVQHVLRRRRRYTPGELDLPGRRRSTARRSGGDPDAADVQARSGVVDHDGHADERLDAS